MRKAGSHQSYLWVAIGTGRIGPGP